MTKGDYVKPVLRVHGKVEDVTKGGSTGRAVDASFPSTTPVGELTFS